MKLCKPGVFALLCLSLTSAAKTGTPRGEWQPVRVGPHTERFDFPAQGVLKVVHSTGNITVEGWDRPEIEITTVKATKDAFGKSEEAKGMAQLEQVTVSAARSGDELTLTTAFPEHWKLPGVYRLHGTPTRFHLEYRIRMPRTGRLSIEHNEGEINVVNFTGNIEARTLQGQITLHLPGDGPRTILANALAGSVVSDFPGTEMRHRIVGHSIRQTDPAAVQTLDLRTGYGDIIVLRMRTAAGRPSR